MDNLTRFMKWAGVKVHPAPVPVTSAPTGPNEDAPYVLDNPASNDYQLISLRDGQNNIGVQRMGVATPGGILNPVVTYADLLPVRLNLVSPMDGRIPATGARVGRSKELEGSTPVRQLFLPSPIQQPYEKTGFSKF